MISYRAWYRAIAGSCSPLRVPVCLHVPKVCTVCQVVKKYVQVRVSHETGTETGIVLLYVAISCFPACI